MSGREEEEAAVGFGIRRKVGLQDTLIEGCISSCVQNTFSECPLDLTEKVCWGRDSEIPAETDHTPYHKGPLHQVYTFADMSIANDVSSDIDRGMTPEPKSLL